MGLFPPCKAHGRGGAFGHKGKGHTVHLLVDKRGLPLAVRTTPANVAEVRQVVPLLKQAKPPKHSVLQADKGYDSEPLRYQLTWLFGMGSAIPKRRYGGNKPHDPSRSTRWKVEQSHAHRHLSARRTAVCYDKSLLSFSAFVICSCIWRLMLNLV
jgi:transposase